MAAVEEQTLFRVYGKAAIVTGAGSGINYEFAKLLLSHGCSVLIADLALRPEAQKLVDEHSKDNSKPRAAFYKTNVTIWDHLTGMFDEAERLFGDVHIVCPGAGVFEPVWTNFWRPPGTAESRDALHGTPDGGVGHYAVLDINITHPIRTTQLALTRWLNPSADIAAVSLSNPKRIVHISSIAGQLPGFGTPMYHASKHAISGFVRSMRQLESVGVRVNGVAPGIIRTPIWTDAPDKLKMIDEEVVNWVEPSYVALQMLRCCEDDTVGAGVILEVTKDATREVGWRNDPGPQGPGASPGNAGVMAVEVFELLGQPGWGVPKS